MRTFRSLVAVAGLLLVGGCGEQTSSGSCAVPRALLSAHHASPGDRLTVTVNYTIACQDTHPGAVSVLPTRYRAVRLVLIQRDTGTTLATADTDREGHLSAEVTIPATARPGDAFIRVDHVDEDAFLTID